MGVKYSDLEMRNVYLRLTCNLLCKYVLFNAAWMCLIYFATCFSLLSFFTKTSMVFIFILQILWPSIKFLRYKFTPPCKVVLCDKVFAKCLVCQKSIRSSNLTFSHYICCWDVQKICWRLFLYFSLFLFVYSPILQKDNHPYIYTEIWR